MLAEATPTQIPPVPPAEIGASPSPPEGPEILILLKGEKERRRCLWPRDDFRALADLDHEVGGLSNLDLALLRHFAATLWVCCAREMTFKEFQDRLPCSPGDIDKMRRGAVMLWQQIM